jgi:hypothetical protein
MPVPGMSPTFWSSRRRLATLGTLGLVATLVARGCAGPDAPGDAGRPAAAPTTNAPTTAPSSATGRASAGPRERALPGPIEIVLRVRGTRLTATLLDHAAARDLVGLLPLTLTMSDHGAVEKTGRLPTPLSTTGLASGADPSVGDLGYYAPGTDLVLYYGDQSYFDGIVRLGTLHGDLSALERMDGDLTVRLDRAPAA